MLGISIDMDARRSRIERELMVALDPFEKRFDMRDANSALSDAQEDIFRALPT